MVIRKCILRMLIALGLGMGFSLPALAGTSNPVWASLFVINHELANITEPVLDKLRDAGVEGFEFPGSTASLADCRRVGGYMRSHGLQASLNVAAFNDRDISSFDPVVQRQGIQYLREKIDCAQAIGATVLTGPFVLPLGYWPDLVGRGLTDHLAAKKAHAVNPIRELATYAAEHGVQLALEYVTRWEMPGLNSLSETISLVDHVNHENFGVAVDSSHEVLDGEGPSNYQRNIDWLHTHGKLMFVHVSAPHRGDLVDSWMPWEQFFGPLRDVWDGPLSIEIMNGIAPFALPKGEGLRIVRPPFEDPYAVVQRSVAATRSAWEGNGT